MVVGLMGTSLISPLYALYKDAWHLQTSDISLIYVIYMGGALCALLFVGRLPDRAGFRLAMVYGLALAMIGTFISLIAWNMASLSVGRFVMGVASSIVMVSAASGLSKLSRPGNSQRTAMVNGFLMAFGFGLGPLVGGIIGQWAPAPLVNAYIPTLILGVLGLIALRRLEMPEDGTHHAIEPFHCRNFLPKLTWPASDVSKSFLLTCCLPFLAFAVFGLYAAMTPLFLDRLVPWHGPAVSGIAIALILLGSALIQVMAGRMPTQWCGFFGLFGLAASSAVLIGNLRVGSAILFAFGVLLTAMGHAMSMLAGMCMVNRLANPGNRAGLMSTYMVIGYVGSMVPVMGIGWIADRWGLEVAVRMFCTAVIVIGLPAGVLFQRDSRMG